MSNGIQNVVVFCGSSEGNRSSYLECAEALGNELVKNKIGLVYGAGKYGLMGKVAQTVHEGGCKVVGIISKHLHAGKHDAYGETIIVDTMHERKKLMFDKVDGIIAIPGGFGTMEELLEVLTWYQLKLHCKPIGLLNIDGYYDKFLEWIQHSVQEGFIVEKKYSLISHSDPVELLKMMKDKVKSA